jgi:hypothetical protein
MKLIRGLRVRFGGGIGCETYMSNA